MEAQGRGFGGVVVDHARRLDVGADARDGDHVAVVRGDHVREELLRHVPVRQGVYREDKVQLAGRGAENVLAAAHAGVVDHHGRVPDCAPHALGGGVDGGWNPHVRVDVHYVFGFFLEGGVRGGRKVRERKISAGGKKKEKGTFFSFFFFSFISSSPILGGSGGHTSIIIQREHVQHHNHTPHGTILPIRLRLLLLLLPFPFPFLLSPSALTQLPTQPQYDLLADPRAAASHYNHLLVPIPRVVLGPVILRALGQPRVDAVEDAETCEVVEGPGPRRGRRVLQRGECREEEDWARQPSEKEQDGVEGEACRYCGHCREEYIGR